MHTVNSIVNRLLALAATGIVAFASNATFAQGGNFTKLPASVNSPTESEVLPVISADGKWLYFARPRVGIDGNTVIDIWCSRHDSTDRFATATIQGGKLASRYGIAVTSVAPDDNTLFLIGKLREAQRAEDRVMVTHRTKDGWAVPQPIHINDLNARGNVIDFAFGPDQRTLILSMQHDSSMGGQDLFVCFLDEKSNTWSTPLWLGAVINSRSNEITPYLAADGKTLYFSSDRPGGVGELDVWRAERLDDSWRHWSAPEHLDNTINRPGRTSYYSEDAAGKYAYYVWRRSQDDQSDIFRSPAPARIVPVVLLSGRVHDETGATLEATIRYERLSDGKTLGLAHSDPATGAFQIAVPAGEVYSLYAEQHGYIPTSESFDTKAVKAYSTITKDLTLVKIKENAVVRLNNIFFETDKATLLPESFAELHRLADVMNGDQSIRVAIEGYTDSTGSAEHNKKLSEARANAVAEYLISQTVASNRLEAHGYGPEHPLESNATEEGREKNRRVEFRIVGK